MSQGLEASESLAQGTQRERRSRQEPKGQERGQEVRRGREGGARGGGELTELGADLGVSHWDRNQAFSRGDWSADATLRSLPCGSPPRPALGRGSDRVGGSLRGRERWAPSLLLEVVHRHAGIIPI